LLAPIIVVLLALEYHAIARWEEQLLLARIGEPYQAYTAQVPRWVPRLPGLPAPAQPQTFSWGDTLFSERGTLMALVFGYALLYLKERV
jgi:hypothetical protein